jgi:hypothetical protein
MCQVFERIAIAADIRDSFHTAGFECVIHNGEARPMPNEENYSVCLDSERFGALITLGLLSLRKEELVVGIFWTQIFRNRMVILISELVSNIIERSYIVNIQLSGSRIYQRSVFRQSSIFSETLKCQGVTFDIN